MITSVSNSFNFLRSVYSLNPIALIYLCKHHPLSVCGFIHSLHTKYIFPASSHIYFAWLRVILSFLRQDFLLATHVRTQSNRNVHAAILIYVVLQECDQSSGRSQYGIVQCVYQISSIFTLGTDTQTSCLCITQGRTGTNLKVLLLSGAPCFYVAGFTFRSARSPLQHSRVRTGTSRLRKNSTV